MKYALYFGILVYLYITTSVAAVIGINQGTTASTLVISLLSLVYLLTHPKKNYIAIYKQEIKIIVLATLVILIKFIRGDADSIKQTIIFMIIPVIMHILLDNQDKLVKKQIFNIIMFFFITECFLAIYERFYLINIFPLVNELDDINLNLINVDIGFRSTSFLGHPLQNALCLSTIMGFILTSHLKLPYKTLFILIGFTSLLCFNARGALIMWIIIIFIYYFNISLSKQRRFLFTNQMVILYFVAAFVIFDLIFNQNFGDRLFSEDSEIMDASAQSRLIIDSPFSYMSMFDFLIGSSKNLSLLLSGGVGAGYENSYILMITELGAILSSILFIIYFFWIRKLFKHHSVLNKLIIILSFIGVGSMNNSLYNSQPWMFFILCINSFIFFTNNLTHSQATKIPNIADNYDDV